MPRHRRIHLFLALTIAATVVPAGATPLETGTDPAEVAGSALDRPGLPNDPLRGTYFVTQQYRDLLGREPDAAGLAFWKARLDAGLAASAMVGVFVDSPEFAKSRQPSPRLYLAAFGRFPDEAGWSYWSQQLAAGTSLEQLATWFIETPEGEQRLGGREDQGQLIEALYRNVLGRSSDGAGRDYWLGQLASGRTRSQVVVAFSESAEFRTSVDDEILATLLYRGLLGRAPEPPGLAYWMSTLVNGAAFESIVGGFLGGRRVPTAADAPVVSSHPRPRARHLRRSTARPELR